MTTTIEITGIRARPVLVPLRRVLNTRIGRFTRFPMLLVDLELKGGGAGRAMCPTFFALGFKLVPVVLQELAASIKGRKIAVEDLPKVHDAGQALLSHLGHEGVTQMALSFFDMALYDAMAREAGVPLYKLLGGRAEPIPTYNSCGLGLMAPQDAAREAKELAAEHERIAGGVDSAIEIGVVDEKIDPAHTRSKLTQALAEAPQRRGRHKNIPL